MEQNWRVWDGDGWKEAGQRCSFPFKGSYDLGCRKMGSRALDFGLRLGASRHKSEAVCFEYSRFRFREYGD